MCHRISQAHEKIEELAKSAQGITPELATAPQEHAAIHLECQQTILGHIYQTAALMERWASRVAAFLYRMTGQREAAADLAQETFVKLYQAWDRYRADGNFSTYLFAIASNLAKNHTRWRMRHPTVSLDVTADEMHCQGGGDKNLPGATSPQRTAQGNVLMRSPQIP